MENFRRKTKVINIGKVKIGGSNPVAIQSMTKTKTADVSSTVSQIKELQACGCEIVRLAIKDEADARAINDIKKQINLPLVADIHFNWRLAIQALESGADKIRLNPGNIYKKEEVRNVISALKQAKKPLRIGLNSGSVKYSNTRMSMAEKLAASCLDYIKLVESFKFNDIVVSLKCSDVLGTIEAYRKISKRIDYPLHLGVTATGLPYDGAIKSGIAIGVLLLEGIGDTIRISLTDTPAQEVRAAKAILEATQMRVFGPQIISCPTCGRCEVNLSDMVKELEKNLLTIGSGSSDRPLKVAVMGCVVNGPGEAKEADLGIAFGKKDAMFFRKGKQIRKVPLSQCVKLLTTEIKKNAY
ncbi:MAG: flavodoxin-dependent (E)-4-hydroxy-3-methylbut-2-enyl-diphosphate synthase [Candidatus Omnitrophica bacterium]|nr:flavodoxin-dependent (E)-4-hydroxy-3-methylbut-2-enyl-diphosphate synthase [Candidatus Omnitrophota bacterium]